VSCGIRIVVVGGIGLAGVASKISVEGSLLKLGHNLYDEESIYELKCADGHGTAAISKNKSGTN
jgi:hypothetical protein